MVALVLGMILCVALAVWVVALVAVPARREGRDLLTPRGEHVVDKVAKAAKAIDPTSSTAADHASATPTDHPATTPTGDKERTSAGAAR